MIVIDFINPNALLVLDDSKFQTRAESKTVQEDRENFTENDLKNLPELIAPDIMPNGNVGTPTLVFLDFIKQCRLPPKVIKKLGLTFPKTRTNKQYGSVPFDYGREISEGSVTVNLEVKTASGHNLVSENDFLQNTNNGGDEHVLNASNDKSNKKSWRNDEARKRMNLNIEEKMIGTKEDSDEVPISSLFRKCLYLFCTLNLFCVKKYPQKMYKQ